MIKRNSPVAGEDQVKDGAADAIEDVAGLESHQLVAGDDSESGTVDLTSSVETGDESVAGADFAPGQIHMPVAGDDAAAVRELSGRAATLKRIRDKSRASELREAEIDVAATGVSLTAAERRDIRDIADSPEEESELVEERLAQKRNEQAMRRARQKVNESVPSRTLLTRPGYGPSHGNVQIHVRDSFAFLLGRSNRDGKFYISGLFDSSVAARKVVQGHHAGCPYATWYLIQIEKEIHDFRILVAEMEEKAKALVQAATFVRMNPFVSRQPAEVPLDFVVSYGFWFVDLLVRYDNVLRLLQPYLRQKFISLGEYAAIQQPLGKALRRMLRLPSRWRFVGRDAVLQKTHAFYAAEHEMGVLPQEILEGAIKPELV